MKHKYSAKEKKYLENFKNTSLDIGKFHHKEHIKITYVLLIDNNIENTYFIIKNGILNILKKVGVDITKYHETMTYSWILIIKSFMEKTKECKDFEEFISHNPKLMDINTLYEYYSKELISTKYAREQILNPDIKDIKSE